MHFVKVKGILSLSNNMYLYRGYPHGYIYIVTQEANAIIWSIALRILKLKKILLNY